jgi:hypothetical protein
VGLIESAFPESPPVQRNRHDAARQGAAQPEPGAGHQLAQDARIDALAMKLQAANEVIHRILVLKKKQRS